MNELKKCTKCFTVKPLSEYYKHHRQTTGYRPDCKSCTNKRSKEWSTKNAESRRFSVLKSATGVDKDSYLRLLRLQDNRCPICNKDRREVPKNFAVDHDHLTGKVRGLLCNTCNLGLGYFYDNPDLLNKAISYLANPVGINEDIYYKIK
jgi:hypothetical protein